MNINAQDLIADLQWRGLIHQTTNMDELLAQLSTPTSFFVGFDPTAASLHIGSLQQLMTARRLQLAGHKPFLLVGGGTGLIGDPKPDAERTLSSKEQVSAWTESITEQVHRFVDFNGVNGASVVNNADWLANLSTLDFLRDVGKHFSVNVMLSKDLVASRLESGISFTEFSFMLLQGLDFLELFKNHGVKLQIGGSDQWGNIVTGTELIRKSVGGRAHAMTSPLLLKPDGTKFGKTESGAVWLDGDLTSPLAFHQFWLGVEDAQIPQLLRVFSLSSREEIENLEALSLAEPWRRHGQRHLADELTTLVHGPEAAAQARQAGEALFSGKLQALSGPTFELLIRELQAQPVVVNDDLLISDLAVMAGVVSSKSEARRAFKEGSLRCQGEVVREDAKASTIELFHLGSVFLQRGKKRMGGLLLER